MIAEGIDAGQAAIARFQLGGGITPGEAAWLTVAMRETQVRDDFWSRLQPEDRQQNLRLLIELTRLVRTPYIERVATLLGFVAWQCGNGALPTSRWTVHWKTVRNPRWPKRSGKPSTPGHLPHWHGHLPHPRK